MAKTSDAMLKAIQKYKGNLDEVRFSVKGGGKDQIRQVAKDKGFSSVQAYMKHLIHKDSGLDL